jgi:hypothetical protein
MPVKQIITITDNSNTHATLAELMDKLTEDCSGLATTIDMVESCTADGTLVTTEKLSEEGDVATITRMWHDECWTKFSALEGVDASVFADAGWTVVSEDSPALPGLTTRQDDAFGTDQDEE